VPVPCDGFVWYLTEFGRRAAVDSLFGPMASVTSVCEPWKMVSSTGMHGTPTLRDTENAKKLNDESVFIVNTFDLSDARSTHTATESARRRSPAMETQRFNSRVNLRFNPDLKLPCL
jgi:hypothetical protein